MIIEQTEEGLLIKTTAQYNIKAVQRIVDYMTVLEITVKTEGTQEQANELASEANKKWWAENKLKFIG